MLTPEQKQDIANDAYELYYGGGYEYFRADGDDLSDVLDKAYAAGAKYMQERCAKAVNSHEWIGGTSKLEICAAIRALETT